MVCPISGLVASESVSQDGAPPVVEDCRAALSIARMNWLHSHFSIVSSTSPIFFSFILDDCQSNDAYLYTLALFMLEPIVSILTIASCTDGGCQ